MIKVLENENFTLVVYPDKGIVQHTIHKWITGDDLKTLFLAGAETFKKHNCTKWLSNDNQNGAIRRQDVDWIHQNWEPEMLSAGWKYWAVILPALAVGRMTMKRLIERLKTLGVTVVLFEDEETAMEWLDKVG